MFKQQNWHTVVGYFRPSRKCLSFNGSLLFLLILLVGGIAHQTAARPSHDEDLPPGFNVNEEFRDVDNLEIHRVKVVNGVEHEDHPIIIYKEDLVNEDYVPPKNETKAEKHKRRYKDIAHRRRHSKQNMTDVVIEEKPEKMLFDIIPEKPLIVPEDMEKHRKSHMKLVPLIDDFSVLKDLETEEVSAKEELHKRPKKFHRRVRRSTNGEHIVRKRNPYFRHLPKVSGEVPTQVQYIYVKHAVPGKKHNGLDIPVAGPKPTSNGKVPISFDNRVAADENDRVIFSSGRPTQRPTSRPVESIFRDPRPENFDFSFMNPQRPATTTRTPIFTRRPEVTSRPQQESIFRDPKPENFDFSFMNQGQQTQQQTSVARAPTASPQPASEAGISQCVWAIVNCCSSRNTEIRYSCFEQNGCYGAFWGLNPCADNVRDTFINYVADYYN
ncbi:hypothetical protein FF38_07885 [Lucilia cuprina]|uniref:Uncharacterized protein n=1 Tax=Lucilia cuprina TaxID=7375 RepID=A0A0L0BXZ4_LUCCU|nr:hypothetical protein CVS40_0806 [Lucilia cuprina]KAI8130832.1 hypothetical protein CVS40_0806 [Lucilia cuprina]KNC24885.1 hypothetical protein FF38_07885 [Lucilia cuprina]